MNVNELPWYWQMNEEDDEDEARNKTRERAPRRQASRHKE